MLRPELSDTMSVGFHHIVAPCQCATCQTIIQVEANPLSFIIDNEVFDFKKPTIKCPKCNSSYIIWDMVQITQ